MCARSRKMDWDGLSAFLQEIKLFLEKSRSGKQQEGIVSGLIEQCEFFISTTTSLRFNDEVDNGLKGGTTYLNMAGSTPNKRVILDTEESHSEYIDMDDYEMAPTTPPAASNLSPTECPYMGLPFAHLKLNKNVLIIQENTKITGKKSTVTCALLKGSWLLCYSSTKPNALKPNKFYQIDHLDVPSSPEQSLQLTLYCCEEAPQTLHFETGGAREMWIKAVREELPSLEDGVYDDPNNLRMDDHLYKTIKFDYDIPKMPPKPVKEQDDGQQPERQQRVSPNRAEFQLKYQEIKEQLASQLKQQKGGVVSPTERSQRSNSIISPQKKFGRFMNMFRSSSNATGSHSPPPPLPQDNFQSGPAKKSSSPDKTAKIMKYKRNTTIFSPDYEIVGS